MSAGTVLGTLGLFLLGPTLGGTHFSSDLFGSNECTGLTPTSFLSDMFLPVAFSLAPSPALWGTSPGVSFFGLPPISLLGLN